MLSPRDEDYQQALAVKRGLARIPEVFDRFVANPLRKAAARIAGEVKKVMKNLKNLFQKGLKWFTIKVDERLLRFMRGGRRGDIREDFSDETQKGKRGDAP